MFESLGRGLKMILASIKMGWEDKRLLLPSILTVFTNLFFGLILMSLGSHQFNQAELPHAGTFGAPIHSGGMSGIFNLISASGVNGLLDLNGMGNLGVMVDKQFLLLMGCLLTTWWLTNRFFEGVTTALVYNNLSGGPGSGKFSDAAWAVLSGLPAIMILGLVTIFARKIAGGLRRRVGGGGAFGFGFLAGIVEVFWTLAGHLILPAIVIEGTSFWGGLKRADKIASGNLITIGVGEVGVDGLCRLLTGIVYVAGVAAFGYTWYNKLQFTSLSVIAGAILWASSVVLVTALSIYIRAAFYACLYAWAIDAEAVHESERSRIRPPAPLAAALS